MMKQNNNCENRKIARNMYIDWQSSYINLSNNSGQVKMRFFQKQYFDEKTIV